MKPETTVTYMGAEPHPIPSSEPSLTSTLCVSMSATYDSWSAWLINSRASFSLASVSIFGLMVISRVGGGESLVSAIAFSFSGDRISLLYRLQDKSLSNSCVLIKEDKYQPQEDLCFVSGCSHPLPSSPQVKGPPSICCKLNSVQPDGGDNLTKRTLLHWNTGNDIIIQ